MYLPNCTQTVVRIGYLKSPPTCAPTSGARLGDSGTPKGTGLCDKLIFNSIIDSFILEHLNVKKDIQEDYVVLV